MSNRMKNVWKRVGVFVIAAILVAGGMRMAAKEESAKSSAMSEETYRMAEGEGAMEDATVDTAELEADGVGKDSGTVLHEDNLEQKMIVTWDISIETEQYQTLMELIVKSVKERQGYIESESEQTGDSENRTNYLTVRMPADKAEKWMDEALQYGTIRSKMKNQENVTLTYIDTESRIKALKSEQKALLKLMEQAENMEDLISIQSKITEVNSEIESYQSQLNYLQNQVEYTTINMNITEVKREVSNNHGFSGEIKETFLGCLDGIRGFLRGVVVVLIGYSPVILLLGMMSLLVVWFVKKKRKKEKQDKENTVSE